MHYWTSMINIWYTNLSNDIIINYYIILHQDLCVSNQHTVGGQNIYLCVYNESFRFNVKCIKLLFLKSVVNSQMIVYIMYVNANRRCAYTTTTILL